MAKIEDGFVDLGREYDLCNPCGEATASEKKNAKKRVDYPTLYIRGIDVPDLGEGEFEFVAKGKIIGFRDPIDEDSEKSFEIAVLAIKMKNMGVKTKKELSSEERLAKEFRRLAGEDDDTEE